MQALSIYCLERELARNSLHIISQFANVLFKDIVEDILAPTVQNHMTLSKKTIGIHRVSEDDAQKP